MEPGGLILHSSLHDGVRRALTLVLGLLTILFNYPRPRLILLDDLDRGLHPKAQKDLVAHLRKMQKQAPELQVIATTSHPPYLVDHLDPEEVRRSTVLPCEGPGDQRTDPALVDRMLRESIDWMEPEVLAGLREWRGQARGEGYLP